MQRAQRPADGQRFTGGSNMPGGVAIRTGLDGADNIDQCLSKSDGYGKSQCEHQQRRQRTVGRADRVLMSALMSALMSKA